MIKTLLQRLTTEAAARSDSPIGRRNTPQLTALYALHGRGVDYSVEGSVRESIGGRPPASW